MVYRWIADLVMLAHFGFVAFVVLGGYLAWWWRWLIVPHVVAVTWGALTVVVGLTCPLTAWEDRARRLAGEQGLTRGFIDTYLTGVVYPERYLVATQLLVAILVTISWVARVGALRGWWLARSSGGADGGGDHR